jgi:hypothetical protein
MDPVSMAKVSDTMPMYAKYSTAPTKLSIDNFEKKYQIAYRNKCTPENPDVKYDLRNTIQQYK